MKQTIRLNENELKQLIKESVKRMLKESSRDEFPPYYWAIIQLYKTKDGEFETYGCAEDSSTSDDASQPSFPTPDEAYNDGLDNLKYYNEGDYRLEVYFFYPNGAGECVSGYMAEMHDGKLIAY